MVFKDLEEAKEFVEKKLGLRKVVEKYPFKITRHIMEHLRNCNGPLWRQFIPTEHEIANDDGYNDPLDEERLTSVEGLVHRYPDRVLWLVTSSCAAYCRFCTRKRIWKQTFRVSKELIANVLHYISARNYIHDVIISGGDPLLLPASVLEEIFFGLKLIKHVFVLRLGTRLPVVAPNSITESKLNVLRKYQPLYVLIHINHPCELTSKTVKLIEKMADMGIPMASQTVLLKGINDDVNILKRLFLFLLSLRIRPYYLLQMDLVRGTSHFRVPISKGLEIMRDLRHNLSGLAMPHYMIDLPGGGGKVELVPSFIVGIEDDRLLIRNREGDISFYPLFPDEIPVLKSVLHQL